MRREGSRLGGLTLRRAGSSRTRRARTVRAFFIAIALLGAAVPTHADPAPVDGILFTVDSLAATGTSPVGFTVQFRDQSVIPLPFQVQYAFDPNALDEEWTDAGKLVGARKLGTSPGFRYIPVTISSLAPAAPTIVYFRVRAVLTHGTLPDSLDLVNGPWTEPDGAVLGPKAPTKVAITLTNDDQPKLTWQNNATGDPLWAGTYIYRAEANGSQRLYATLPVGDSEFIDTDVDPFTKYTYSVVSYRQTSVQAHIETSTSYGVPSPVSITTGNIIATTIPAAPSGLGAEAISSLAIKLTWTDNADNEDGFVIERSVDNGATFQIRATKAIQNLEQYVDEHLFPGSTYLYRVRAFNSGGQSPPSNVAGATTPSLPPPVWISPDSRKQNQIQPYECAIFGTADYNAGVQDVFVVVTDTISGLVTNLPFAPVNPTTHEWRITWHTYEFKPGRYHLKAYSHVYAGFDFYSTPISVIGWTVPADSIPCSITNP